MKTLSTGLAILCSILVFIPNSSQKGSTKIDQFESLLSNQILCSTGNNVGRCTGSIYCTACKNCKYCGYCNSGGSCGVCGKRSKPNYFTPKKKKKTTKKHSTPRYNSNSKKSYQLKTPASQNGQMYIVIQKTSLRILNNSRSKVLKRLKVNDEIIVLDSSGRYWWEVNYMGQIGWVKSALLKRKKKLNLP